MAQSVLEDLRKYVLDTYVPELEGTLTDDAPLFDGGILDSVHMVSVMLFLQQQYGVRFDPSELTADNFKSLRSITALVQKKAPTS
jgi:methoxymalonate biosynthesis acyl carrier protein